MTPIDLHEQIAETLGWSLADVQSFNLRALRELVRPVNPKIAQRIGWEINKPSHYIGEPLRRPRRW
jgi:hypothetical protein